MDTDVSAAEGTTISHYGYSFEVPWNTIDQERNEGRTTKLIFKTGQTISYAPENSDQNPIDPVAYHVGDFTGQDDFRLAFGTPVRESKYEQFKAVISTAPSQFSLFCSHREFVRTVVLLGIKGLWFEHNSAAPDIFSFETKDYRGFEISGLSENRQNVVLHFFDKKDQHWFTIGIVGNARSGVRLTQFEINRVIQSFRAAAPSSPPSHLPN